MINNEYIQVIIADILKYNKYFNNGYGVLYPLLVEEGFAMFDVDGEMCVSSVFDDSKGNYFYIRRNGKSKLLPSEIGGCNNGYTAEHNYSLIAFVEGKRDELLYNLFHTLNAHTNLLITAYSDNTAEAIFEEIGEYALEVLQRINARISVVKIDFKIVGIIGVVKDLDNCLKEVCPC